MPVEESIFLLAAFKSVIAGCDGRGDALGRHRPSFDGGIVRAGGNHVRGKGVEAPAQGIAQNRAKHLMMLVSPPAVKWRRSW